MVDDPYLSQHLTHFGIKIKELEKVIFYLSSTINLFPFSID